MRSWHKDGQLIRDKGIQLELLEIVDSMDEETGEIIFRKKEGVIEEIMASILVITALSAVLGGAVWKFYLKDAAVSAKKENNAMYIITVMVIGVIAHIIGAMCYYGHPTDMGCFSGWSDRIFADGLRAFYTSDGFHDYPPGYVYVMWLLGALKHLFNLQNGMWQLTLKLPSIVADMVMGWLVYKLAKRKFSDGVSATLAAILVMNPAVITDSAIWGQIDSLLGLFCLLSVYYASEKKLVPAFFMFAIGILIKPQALFFTPVLIYGVIDEVFLGEGGFDARKLCKYVIWALAAIAMMLVLFLPFGIPTIIMQYTETLGEYQYMTINAFNIYGAVGKNWESLGTASTVFGYLMIALVVAYSAYVFFKSNNPAKYYITAFILTFGVYMLAIKMHERYAFPGIFMLIFALITVPDTKNFNMYGLFSLSQFFNMAWILFIYNQDINKYFRYPVVSIASVVNVVLTVYIIYVIQKRYVNYKVPVNANAESGKTAAKKVSNKLSRQIDAAKAKKENKASFRVSEEKTKLTKTDFIALGAIILVYSVIALTNLGNTYAPETETVLNDGAVTVDLGSERDIAQTLFYNGARQLEDNRSISFRYLDNNKNEVLNDTNTSGAVFYWTVKDINTKARYIEISAATKDSEPVSVREVCFLDNEGNQLEPVNLSDVRVGALFDEQDTMVINKDFMGGTYFDEIYHARTAYEFIHHMTVYEWTHPPLGKVLISIGIRAFGMNPFGWRIVGTLFGIFMIPAIYLFAKRIFKKSWLTIVTTVLFTFDFMHFAQTRISTIDVYVTFFIILMYYYMYKYYKMSFYDTPLKKTLIPLGLSGVFFGFAWASKWTGLYAGAGLAIIFFYTIYERYEEYRIANRTPKGVTFGISHKKVIESFKKNTLITLGFCVVMFIIVPIIIYTLSYIPYMQTPSGHGLRTMIENANSMYTYHSKTVANSTHPYSSHWYEWPIMYRPIWYFSNTLDSGLKQGISAFGNPAVWWLGIGAVAYMTALAMTIPLKKRKYMGVNKYIFLGIYAIIFCVLCAASYAAAGGSEKLERLFPCMLFYSSVMVGAFALTLTYDENIKQESNRIALFLIIGYFAELIPWVLVVRTTYIYHYFPCVPFTVLMIGYSILTIYENVKEKNRKTVMTAAFVYAGIAVVLFAMFYPVLSGNPCNYDYADKWLKWFDSWVLL